MNDGRRGIGLSALWHGKLTDMNESSPSNEKPRSEWPIEQQANFEGSWTNLMCERLRNPEIRKQVIDLLVLEEEAVIALTKNAFNKQNWGSGTSGNLLTEKFSGESLANFFTPKTRQEIEDEFENRLKMVSRDTPISFDTKTSGVESNGREIVNLEWVFPVTGKKLTEKQLNFTESHEKGHVLRPYSKVSSLFREGEYIYPTYHLGEKFLKAFDFDKVTLTEQDIENKRQDNIVNNIKWRTRDEISYQIIEYLKQPGEIAERMAQLKNYFGMRDNEQFTKEHLLYAKKHFSEDTEFDNWMTQFFQAITPEKEDVFIELINSAGI